MTMKKPDGDQRAMSVDGVILNDQYDRAKEVVRMYRLLSRNMDSLALIFDSATSEPIYEKKDEHADVRLAEDRDLSKAVAIAWADYINERKKRKGSGCEIPGGNGYRYEYRQYWTTVVDRIHAAGGPYFGTNMWDSMRKQLISIRTTKMVDYGETPREWLINQGVLDPLRLTNLGVKFLNNSITKDERGWVVRLQYGTKHDYLEFLLHGETVQNGKTYTPRLTKRDISILKHIVKGTPGWGQQTITLNMKHSKSRGPKFWLHIPYRKPAREVIPGSAVCEVTFEKIAGVDLPRGKNDTGTDDDKTFVIHVSTDSWAKHLPVDGVLSNLRNRQARKRLLERERDCRRRLPKKFLRPIRDTLAGMTKSRLNLARHMNHNWASSVVRMARSGRCGIIKIFNTPSTGLLLDNSIPWVWSQFVEFVKYKAKEWKIEVEVVENSISEILQEVGA